MNNLVFASMVKDIIQEDSAITFRFPISSRQFARWRKLYTWDALTSQRYGQSFCNHFRIRDMRLYYERNAETCDRIIKNEYLDRS